ncbi:GIY-YIG nuclease family protein [Microbacterium sp.]|uniref:GIY-YIG nuclease family protein n=1 Tax=Microbacterium sp. TaxID=51671 RepID=UPI0039E65DE1
MPYVYLLTCADGTLYAGSTLDLDRRLAEHAAGEGAAYTRRRLPVELFWFAEYERIDEAFAWEKRLQGWSHRKRIAFAEGGLDAVRGWSARERAERRGLSGSDSARSRSDS